MLAPHRPMHHSGMPRAVTMAVLATLALVLGGCDRKPAAMHASVASLQSELKAALAQAAEKTPAATKDRASAEWDAIWTAVTSATPKTREELVRYLEGTPRAEKPSELDLASTALLEPLAKDNRRDLIVRLLRHRDGKTAWFPLVCTLQSLRCRGLLDDGLGVLFEAYDAAQPKRQKEIEELVQHELVFFNKRDRVLDAEGRAFVQWTRVWYAKEGDRLLPNFRVGISGDEDVFSAPALIDVAVVLDRLLANAREAAKRGRNPLRDSFGEDPPKSCATSDLDPETRELLKASCERIENPEFRPRITHIAAIRRCNENWLVVDAMFEDGDRPTSGGFGPALRLRVLLHSTGSTMSLVIPDE